MIDMTETLRTSGLGELRDQITSVDAELMQIFNRRMDLAEQIAHQDCLSVSRIRRRTRSEVSNPMQRAGREMATRVDSMMKTMMRISRERQYDILMNSDTQGSGRALAKAERNLDFVEKSRMPERWFIPEQAASKLFPIKRHAGATFSAACMPFEKKRTLRCCLVENTIAGTVDNVYELLQKHHLYIVSAR